MEKKFKPYDKILTRMKDGCGVWIVDFYSHQKPITKYHVTIGFNELEDDDILPYEGNEHLVGTSDEPDEVIKLEEGEILLCTCSMDFNLIDSYHLRKYRYSCGSTFNGNWNFAIRFRDFDPSNMEETRKHILCVKNGKIIRYKG